MLPENQDVWRLWVAAQTQWRSAGAVLIGLDYLAVDRLADWLGIELGVPGILRGIQLLEERYLAYQAERIAELNHG